MYDKMDVGDFFSIFACVLFQIAGCFSIANQNNEFMKAKLSTTTWKATQGWLALKIGRLAF